MRLIASPVRADVVLGPDGRSRGHGTVLFSHPVHAQRAIAAFHGFQWHGRTLEVRLDRALPLPSPSSPSPSLPYMLAIRGLPPTWITATLRSFLQPHVASFVILELTASPVQSVAGNGSETIMEQKAVIGLDTVQAREQVCRALHLCPVDPLHRLERLSFPFSFFIPFF